MALRRKSRVVLTVTRHFSEGGQPCGKRDDEIEVCAGKEGSVCAFNSGGSLVLVDFGGIKVWVPPACLQEPE